MSLRTVSIQCYGRPAPRYALRDYQFIFVVLGYLLLISASHAASTDVETQLTMLKNQEVALAEHLIQAFPLSEEPLVIMGNVQARHGHSDQALVFWGKAVVENPQRVDVYHKMADMNFQMDKLDEAIALWRKILEVDPKMQGVHVKIAEALMNRGDYDQCIAEVRKEALVSGKESVDTNFLLGRAYQHQQNYEQARQYYEQVIASAPDHMQAYYALYNVCVRLKDRDAAKGYMTHFSTLKAAGKDALREYDEVLPSDIDCFYQSLAKFNFDTQLFYQRIQKDPNVVAVLQQSLSMGQSNPAFLKRLAELKDSAGRKQEALALYVHLTQITPDDITGYVKVGVLSVQLGLLDVAEKAFGEVIARDPNEYMGYQELSRLYLRMKKNLPEARTMAQKTVDLKPSAPAYYDLSLACLANRDLDAALTAMELAVRPDPRDPRYARVYAMLKQKKGGKP